MQTIRALIVDDERLARETLRLLLDHHESIEIIGECEDGSKAVDVIREEEPDLVFLDIQMPEMNGFEVIETIGPNNMPIVIFVTAYDQYALRAFEAQALDYLLKPFDDDRFEQALNRAVERVQQRQVGSLSTKLVDLLSGMKDGAPDDGTEADPPGAYVERIMIKERGSISFVKVDDIDWIEAAGDYVSIHAGKKAHLIRETMTGLTKKLDPNRFVRIHRSSIVSIDAIKELKPYFHGDYIVILKNGKELKLSRRYWDQVEKALGQ